MVWRSAFLFVLSLICLYKDNSLQRVSLPSMVFPPKVYQVRAQSSSSSSCRDVFDYNHFISLTRLCTTVPGLGFRLCRLHPLRL